MQRIAGDHRFHPAAVDPHRYMARRVPGRRDQRYVIPQHEVGTGKHTWGCLRTFGHDRVFPYVVLVLSRDNSRTSLVSLDDDYSMGSSVADPMIDEDWLLQNPGMYLDQLTERRGGTGDTIALLKASLEQLSQLEQAEQAARRKQQEQERALLLERQRKQH